MDSMIELFKALTTQELRAKEESIMRSCEHLKGNKVYWAQMLANKGHHLVQDEIKSREQDNEL